MTPNSQCDVPTVIVAVPVCNEDERIGACLGALASQVGVDPKTIGIVLFLNNCTDRTAAIVAATTLPVQVKILERTHPHASAGWARRVAMEEAAAWLRSSGRRDGVLLTTDADSRVAPDWIARNLAAIDKGAAAVAGRLALDPVDAAALPKMLHARGRREAAYEALLTEICARVDPDPGDPWPCHWTKSGATIAVTLDAYDLVGGMPDQPTGEDRAFIEAIAAHDLVVRHEPSIVVVTSGRLEGRAAGGVADTIRLRCDSPESPCDGRLEATGRVLARCLHRRRLRRLWHQGRMSEIQRWAPRLAIPEDQAHRIATAAFFGAAYDAVQAASPHLRFRPISPRQLASQIRTARFLLRALRLRDWLRTTLATRIGVGDRHAPASDKADGYLSQRRLPRLRRSCVKY